MIDKESDMKRLLSFYSVNYWHFAWLSLVKTCFFCYNNRINILKMFGLSRSSKIDELMSLIDDSEAIKSSIVMLSPDEFKEKIKNLAEEKLDELLLMLKEEASMRNDISHETKRKQAMGRSYYLQQLEKIRITAESLVDNQYQ